MIRNRSVTLLWSEDTQLALPPIKVSPWPCVCEGRKDISCHWRGGNSRGAEFLIILFKMVKNFKYSKTKFLKEVEINLINISTRVFLSSMIKQNVKLRTPTLSDAASTSSRLAPNRCRPDKPAFRRPSSCSRRRATARRRGSSSALLQRGVTTG